MQKNLKRSTKDQLMNQKLEEDHIAAMKLYYERTAASGPLLPDEILPWEDRPSDEDDLIIDAIGYVDRKYFWGKGII